VDYDEHRDWGVPGDASFQQRSYLEVLVEGKIVQQCSCLFGRRQHGLVGRADFLSALEVGFDRTGWSNHA
jgi:hypothetical protein